MADLFSWQYHQGSKVFCISFTAFTDPTVGLGVPENTYKSLTVRKKLTVVVPGGNGRQAWILFSSIPPKYKALAAAKWGNPEQCLSNSILTQNLKTHQEDLDFLNNYRYNLNKQLPESKKVQYIEALRYLRLLSTTDRAAAQRMGFTNRQAFVEAMAGLIRSNNVDLPHNVRSLLRKLAEFEEKGPTAVIHKGYGNQVARKVSAEVAKALLNQLTSTAQRIDDVYVSHSYNRWAVENNLPTISSRTVTNYRFHNRLQSVAFGQGPGRFHNAYGQVIRQVRPSAPLLLINSDDNDLDLWFIGTNKKGGKSTWVRFTLVVVMDAYNDYILGWAMAEQICNNLVKAAYHSAIHHIRELTGGYYGPHQIKTDHWGLKELRPFYEALATFTPTELGNARGKVIEQAFGTHWHKMLKLHSNYAGHNITARKQINRELIAKGANNFPTVEEAPDIIAGFINNLRHRVTENGNTVQENWLNAWQEMAADRRRVLPDTQRLRLFGAQHRFTNRITNRGLDVTINGEVHGYNVPQEEYARYVGMPMQIFYDPYDLNRVLAWAEDGKVQIVCESAERMPMAIADMQPGDRTRLNRLINQRKAFGQNIIAKHDEELQLLHTHQIDPRAVLQKGMLVKEERMDAERALAGAALPPAPSGSRTILPAEEDEEQDINPYDLM